MTSGWCSLHGVERGGAVAGADHVVAVGEQQLAEERADALGVVSDEHAAAPRLNRRVRFHHDTRPSGTIGDSVRPLERRHRGVESVTFELAVEGAAADAEQPRRDGLVAAHLLERADDVLTLDFDER